MTRKIIFNKKILVSRIHYQAILSSDEYIKAIYRYNLE